MTDDVSAFYVKESGVDWNVIALLRGMMVIVGVLKQPGIFVARREADSHNARHLPECRDGRAAPREVAEMSNRASLPTGRRLPRLRNCLIRAAGADTSPLCRATDRARARLHIMLALALAAVLAAAWSVGAVAYQAGERTAAAQAEQRHSVTAVTLTAGARTTARRPARSPSRPGPGSRVWHHPTAQHRTGQLNVDPGTKAGTLVQVWVDEAGPTGPAADATAPTAGDGPARGPAPGQAA